MARAHSTVTAPFSVARITRVALDVLVLASAYALGFALRFDWQPPWPMVKRFTITLPYVVLFKYALLHYLGITRSPWRQLGLREAVRVLQTLLAATFVLMLVRATLGQLAPRSPVAAAAIIPYGVLAIDFVLAFLGITGIRVLLARPIALEDLLRRAPVSVDSSSIAQYVTHRIVLVTGAGGSIGTELSRQLACFNPAALLLVDHAENNLFFCENALRQQFPQLNLQSFVADITDVRRMEALFQSHRPAVVFHAAAHKHVPLMEQNPLEAVKNNVLGTQIVADLAHRHGAERFVLISTDKAVNPSSVMGATKRVAELYIQALGTTQSTRYCAVRFGNVLGSTGSVVPLFRAQIAAGGPITVTHPEMERYFMTLDEACQLVLQAAALGGKSEIFVLDMGEPMKIVDLARDLIRLSGLREGQDIHIVYSGIRSGEKLHEQLANTEENSQPTAHPKIFEGKIQGPSLPDLQASLQRFEQLVAQEAPAADVKALLQQLIPEYRPWTPDTGASREPS